MIENIKVNGYPVVMSLRIVNEPGEGWQASEFIGAYDNMKDLNEAINKLEVPLYWQIQIDFEDKE